MARPYYGWWMVGFQSLVAMLLLGATTSAFGLYVVPVSQEFGLSRADTNTVLIFMSIGSAVMAPVIGWCLDRAPVKPIVVIGAALAAISFAALSQSRSALLSALLVGVCLTAGRSMSLAPCTVLVIRWFEANRGRALSLGALGTSFGSVLVVPAIGVLIGAFGWRTALLASGVAVAALVIAPALLLRMIPSAEDLAREKRRDEPPGGRPPDAPKAAGPLPARAILAMPQFWLLGAGAAMGMAIAQAVVISMLPMAVESGMSPAKAATLISVTGVMSVLSKLLLAVIADKVDRILLLVAAFCLASVASLALLANTGGYLLFAGCAALLGLSNSCVLPLFAAIVAERFGIASFGTARGLMAPLIAVSSACCLRFAGEVFDRTGGYELAFATFVGLNLVAASLIFGVRFTRATPSHPVVGTATA
jgi:sugar phosphate permease